MRRFGMFTTTLECKVKVAYENGWLDYLAGASCDPETPLVVYDDLDPEEQKVISKAWEEGWYEAKKTESLIEALPDGMPA
jgi:hypothetical protein